MKRFLACLLCVCMALSLCVIGVSAEGETVTYDGETYTYVPQSRIDVSTVAGVSFAKADGSVTYTTTIPADTTTWAQNSGEGSTASYVYCGVFVTAPEGAVKCMAKEDYNNNPEFSEIAGDFFANGKVQMWQPVANHNADNSYSLFSSGREYIILLQWQNSSGTVISNEYMKVTRNIATTETSLAITRTEVSADRLSVAAGQTGVALDGKRISLPSNFSGSSVKIEVVAPSNGMTYTHFNAGTTTQLSNGKATITVPVDKASREMVIEWYTDANTARTFEKINFEVATVASVGANKYPTLSAAIAAAQSSDTVKLLADVNTGDEKFIVSGKNITLDLNGCTVTTTADPFLKVDVGATLKITDNSGSANGTLYEKRDYSYLLLNKGTLVLEKGNFKAESIELYPGESKKLGAFALAMASNSVTTINGGTFTGSLYTNGTSENVNVTINGGTYNDMLYLAARTVNVTINGGTFMKGVETKGSTFNITGGTFYPDSTKDIATDHVPNGDGSSTNGAWAFVVVDNAGYGTVNATISGGTFNGPVAMLDDDSDTTNNNDTLAITGGTFSTDPTAYVAPGYVVSGSGPYTVGVPYIPPTPEKPVTETETTTGTDGSKTDTTTTTTTDKTTGSVTEVKEAVTTAPDGTVTKTETTTVTAKDGAAAEATVATAADGKTTAAVTVKAAPEAASATVPAEVIKAVAEAKADEATLTVTTKDAAIEMDAKAIAALTEKGGEAPVITAQAVDKSALTAQQQALVGDAPVIELNVNGGTIDFGTGTVAVSRPYTLKAGEKAEGMVAWFLNAEGKLEKCECSYQNGVLTFKTSHFSKYVIAYFPFTDVKSGEWYYENVVYAFSNNLFKGVSDTAFAPASAMTRQMIWTVLARMDGKTPANYDEAKEWAVTNGISDGTDAQLQITREQLATILYRYAKYKGYEVSAAMGTAGYPDAKDISDWASEAMTWAVSSGIINGSDGQLLPQDSALRCQVAAMLQRFSEKNK